MIDPIIDSIYDYLIVGAGVAGLYTAYKLIIKYPHAKICIIESTNRIGGRLHSIKYDGQIMDSGGARFNTDQHRVLSLVKELGLEPKIIKLSNHETLYIPIPKPIQNPMKTDDKSIEKIFPSIDDFIKYLKKYIIEKKISHNELINTTILEFISIHFTKTYPTLKQYITDIYPYYSELGILNAIEAVELFSNEFASKTQYMILNGGMEQIVDELHDRLKKSKSHIHNANNANNENNETNIDIFTNTSLVSITYIATHTHTLEKNETDTKTPQHYMITANNESGNTIKYYALNIILAIPKPSLLKIKYLTKHPNILKNLNSVQCEPLYRIYARYPLDKKTNKVWFDKLPKISTNLPIKYIIPINYVKGVIMISYTDSKFANYWLNKLTISNTSFEKELNKQLKQLFPDITIPKAKWYKHYYWKMGAGYWKPKADRVKIMPNIMQPFGNSENIYICGENYSSHQAWVEGSLETADMVIDIISKNDKNNRQHKYKSKSKSKSKSISRYINKNKSKSKSKSKSISRYINKNKNKNKSKSKSKSISRYINKNKNKSKSKSKSISRYINKNKSKSKFKIMTKSKIVSKSKIMNKSKTKKLNSKLKEYTLEEIAKHNTKDNAWIAINGKVANITKWIPKHPGGDVIMKGVGKDATHLFTAVGHDDYAKKMLSRYQIGILKK